MKSLLALFLMVLCSSVFANETSSGVDGDQSLKWLINGNKRFQQQALRSDGQGKADVTRLSTGQKPHAIVLSCSDSRIPPEVVFDQRLGEIFVVRTAGEALDDNVVGSIEYAVEHLGSRLLVVMGHTSCGAVKAAFGTLDGSNAGTPALNGLVKDIHPRIASFKGKTPSPNFEVEAWANTEGVAKDLLKRSALLKEKLEHGELKVVASLYHLDSGHVQFKQDNTSPLDSRKPASTSKSCHSKHKRDAVHSHSNCK